jgi:hypothetical protein
MRSVVNDPFVYNLFFSSVRLQHDTIVGAEILTMTMTLELERSPLAFG